MVLLDYNFFTKCTDFDNYILYGNLLFAGVVALPIFWILFWMVVIKIVCLVISQVCPSILIWFKKKANGI